MKRKMTTRYTSPATVPILSGLMNASKGKKVRENARAKHGREGVCERERERVRGDEPRMRKSRNLLPSIAVGCFISPSLWDLWFQGSRKMEWIKDLGV